MRAPALDHPAGRWQKLAWLFLFLAGVLVPLVAQTALYVQDGDEGRLVQAFLGGRPMVEKNGKLVEPSSARCSLRKVEEYFPVYIAVRDWKVRTSELVTDTGNSLNKTMLMGGELESSVNLERVFVVLELTSEDQGKVLVGW